MTPQVWVALALAATSLMGAAAAWLRGHATQQQLQQHVTTPAAQAHPQGPPSSG